MGNKTFYGRGAGFVVDTTKLMTVVTQFITEDGTDSGKLSEIRRFYVQGGKRIYSPPAVILESGADSITDKFCSDKKALFGDINDYQAKGGSAGMGESLDRGHVMVFSLWDDVEVNMLWLDSCYPLDKSCDDPGVRRGTCEGGVSSTPTHVRQSYPDSWTSFANAAIGEIGSTLQEAPTPITPSPTPAPIACSALWGQCGGKDWSGHTCCEAGSACIVSNPWYSQCLARPSPIPEPTPLPTAAPTQSPTALPSSSTPSPTTKPPSGPCKAFCGENSKDWSKKCGWRKCSGCSECAASMPTPSPTPVPSPPTSSPTNEPSTGICKKWCEEHETAWSKKCKWNKCLGCLQCRARRLASDTSVESMLRGHILV